MVYSDIAVADNARPWRMTTQPTAFTAAGSDGAIIYMRYEVANALLKMPKTKKGVRA